MPEQQLVYIFYTAAGLLLLGAVWWIAERAVIAASGMVAPRAQHTAQATQHAAQRAQPSAQVFDRPPLAQRGHDVNLADIPIKERQNTLIAAMPGDGKTTTLMALLVADIARGVHVVLLNPHYTPYHPEDQRIDVRGIVHRFEAVYEYTEIAATLRGICGIIDERTAQYRAGQIMPYAINVIIDEWPAIAESDVAQDCAKSVQRIVREGRKCDIFLTLTAQDALVKTLGFSGGLRGSFKTRLVGNVDRASWAALLGDIPQRRVKQGTWASPVGDLHVTPPDVAMVAMLSEDAAMTPAIPRDSAETGDSIARESWRDNVISLAAEGASTREILAALGGDYNQIVELARIGRARRQEVM